MEKLMTILGACIAVGITVVTGFMSGQLTQRWGNPADLEQAGTRVASLPSQCGEWVVDQTLELDESSVRLLECAGYANRVYRQQQTGDTVRVIVLVGPPGPISAHTPEICYSSKSHEILVPRQERVVETTSGQQATLWMLSLASRDVSATRSVVYYAWNGGQGWQAAQSPRWDYAGQPMLYKIQLSSAAPAAGDSSDACARFLQDFLPVVDRSLFAQ